MMTETLWEAVRLNFAMVKWDEVLPRAALTAAMIFILAVCCRW